MQLSLAPMQINKIHLCPLGIWWATLECSQNVCSMKSCSCCQLAQLVENSTNEAKVAGLASLDSSVPWPQTSPLASASHPQSMCLRSQSRLGEKVQMNQFKYITATRKTTQHMSSWLWMHCTIFVRNTQSSYFILLWFYWQPFQSIERKG